MSPRKVDVPRLYDGFRASQASDVEIIPREKRLAKCPTVRLVDEVITSAHNKAPLIFLLYLSINIVGLIYWPIDALITIASTLIEKGKQKLKEQRAQS